MIKIAYKNINCSEAYKSINRCSTHKKHKPTDMKLAVATWVTRGLPVGLAGACGQAGLRLPSLCRAQEGVLAGKSGTGPYSSGGNMGPLCPPSGTGPAPVSALCTPGALSHRWDPKTVPSPLPPPALLSRPLPGHSEHQGPIQVLLRWGKQACS